jgi:hypothetical protein
MSKPFEKFTVNNGIIKNRYLVDVEQWPFSAEHHEAQREFIQDAIREKLERSETKEG